MLPYFSASSTGPSGSISFRSSSRFRFFLIGVVCRKRPWCNQHPSPQKLPFKTNHCLYGRHGRRSRCVRTLNRIGLGQLLPRIRTIPCLLQRAQDHISVVLAVDPETFQTQIGQLHECGGGIAFFVTVTQLPSRFRQRGNAQTFYLPTPSHAI
jgi:hypothetical protein